MADKLLVLVDGSYYIFRAYHALPKFTNKDNEPTGAIYGVISMLRKIKADYEPDYIAVVFDARGPTFRNDLYADYKANRPPMPEELASQIGPIHDAVRAMGLPLLMIDRVEADDVIGTLARQAEAKKIRTIISSGDKDLAQLVNDHIHMLNTMNSGMLDPEGVMEKYGVPPERIIDFLSLVGDSVDNIPGVPKVGAKTAAKWLKEYGSLDEIIRHADEFKGKVGQYLRDSIDQLKLSKKLVTLKCDVALDFNPEDLVPGPPDQDALRDQYRRWEFRSWLASLENPDAPEKMIAGTHFKNDFGNPANTVETLASNTTYECISTNKIWQGWLKKLQKAELFAFDTETTSLDYMQARLVGMSFAVDTNRAAYLPLQHDYEGAPEQLDMQEVLEQIKPLLENDQCPKVGHNLKYDRNILANHGITLRGCRHDTMLESYVLNSVASRHDMDTLSERYLGRTTIHYEDVAGKGAKQITFNKVRITEATDYAAEDAEIALRLHQHLWDKLEREPSLKALYEDIEIPLMPVLSDMERNGVAIDPDKLAKQSREITERMADIERGAHEIAGQSFNIGSPKQIQAILYDEMNLPVLAKTPTGQPSTAESVLQDLAVDYELPRLILDHRALSKLKSTYTDKLPKLINRETGRVHTSYHQAVAATGRLSSSDPNLQNIPVRTEDGRRIRQAFVAGKNCLLLAADYSQIELRIMAHLSKDKGLLAAFAEGADIHKQTAAEVFAVSPGKVTADQRRAAKAINFGLIYGMSPFGLAKQLAITRGEAKEYVDRYFDRYPGVRDFMDKTREEARERGYVETLFHRRLYLPEIKSRNAARRQYAERTAINAPMQGTAADIIKRAMIDAAGWMAESRVDAKLIMQVHDELVFEIPRNQVEDCRKHIVSIMSSAAELAVPLIVDTGTGGNWEKAH